MSFDVKFPRYLLPHLPAPRAVGGRGLAPLGRERASRTLAAGRASSPPRPAYLLAFLAPSTCARTRFEPPPSGSTPTCRPAATCSPRTGTRASRSTCPGRARDLFKVVDFPFYEPDYHRQGQAKLAQEVATADFIVLQTKRIYGATTQAHERFPLTSNFFYLLLAGDLGFELLTDFASRPALAGVELPSELADESFSVYDHPKVLLLPQHRPPGGRGAGAAHPRGAADAIPSPAANCCSPGPRPPRASPPLVVRSSWLATVLVVALLELLGLAAWALLTAVMGEARHGLWALGKPVGVPAGRTGLLVGGEHRLAAVHGVRRCWGSGRWWSSPVRLAWRRTRPVPSVREVVGQRGHRLGLLRRVPRPPAAQPRDLLGREAHGLLVPERPVPDHDAAAAGAVVCRVSPPLHLLRPLPGGGHGQGHADRPGDHVQPRHRSGRGAAGRRDPGGRHPDRRAPGHRLGRRGVVHAGRQPLHGARADRPPQRRLRLLLGDVASHPQHHQRVPLVEPGLRGSPRPRPGDALGPHPGGRARPGSGPVTSWWRVRAMLWGLAAAALAAHHDHQRLEHANVPGAGDLAVAGGVARRDRARPQRAGVAPGHLVPPGAADGRRGGRRLRAHPTVLATLPAPSPLLGMGGWSVRSPPRRADHLRAVVGDRRARDVAPVVARQGGRAPPAMAGRPGGRARPGAAAGGNEPAGAGGGSPSSGHLGGAPGCGAAARSAGGSAGGGGSLPLAVGPGDHGNGHGPGVRAGVRVGPHEHRLQVLPGRLAAAGGRRRRSGVAGARAARMERAAVAARRGNGSRRGRLRRDQRRLGCGDAPAHPGAALDSRRHGLPGRPIPGREGGIRLAQGERPRSTGAASRRPGPPTRSSAGSA